MDSHRPGALSVRYSRVICGTIARTFGLTLAGLFAASPVLAMSSAPPGPTAEVMRQLKPGEYVWAPETAPDGPVLIVVSVKSQIAHVYRNGVLIGMSTVSTGKVGHDTPTGVFTVLQKHVKHRSNLYQNAPMPYMQRLTWTGIAMHAGIVPGYPASHGCVRLPLGFAKLLFGVTKVGLTVIISDKEELPQIAPAAPGAAIISEPIEVSLQGEVVWRPKLAQSGPVSIVISTADRRLLVLRNGTEIGSAPATVEGEPLGTGVYLLRAADPSGSRWLSVPLDGRPSGALQWSVPENFRQTLSSLIVPGTTVLVTPDPLRTGHAGQPVTIITSEK